MAVIDRLAKGDDVTDLVALITALYSVPRDLSRVSALAVIPGMGEPWRLIQAIELWQQQLSLEHLLIPGQNPQEKTWIKLSLKTLSEAPYFLTRQENVVVTSVAEHTKEQAEWTLRQAATLKVPSMALMVSPYHLLRTYGTFVRAFERLSTPRIPIIPLPVSVSPDLPNPENGANMWDMIPGEVTRFRAYQEQGDVASATELRDYLSWLWTMIPSRDAATS